MQSQQAYSSRSTGFDWQKLQGGRLSLVTICSSVIEQRGEVKNEKGDLAAPDLTDG